ncbi:MAG: nitroreductase family protein [Oscillospiraceae bacterium]|nr:nitroreductase family protein [Oscillospiraceae bacterium]
MEDIIKIVRGRRSVRAFDGREINADDMDKLSLFIKKIDNPYGIPIEFEFLNGKKQDLPCPVVSGTDLYVGAKAPRVPHIEEAFGYSFEMLVLYAHSIGIGTVWIGGTMDRAAFERAMGLQENEIMPCISPLGYPAKKISIRESMMRKAIKADCRKSFETLFFDGTFDKPLTKGKAGRLAEPLEMVRWAPSAVNKQPWRVISDKNGVHFYLKKAKGFVSEAAGNMQKIDLGIALCHFALAAKENNINICFNRNNPGIAAEADTEYIASYLIP